MSARFDFSGKKVLVTGASQGIGHGICLALSRAGAHVYALARNEAALNALQSESVNVTPIVCDVSQSVAKLKEVLAPYLPFHYLVNNAGVSTLHEFTEITEEAFDRIFSINVKASMFIAQIVANSMIKEGIKGSIVNVSSQASLRPLFKHTVYCSSKAALDMMTKVMAKELGEKSIRVNSVNPTVVMTEMGKMAWGPSNPDTAVMLNGIPLNKFAEIDDVVNAVLFLLSDASPMTTGLAFPVDGGWVNN